MQTLSPKNRRSKQKSGEITRFLLLLERLELQVPDIARLSGVSERTISNAIYQDTPLGGRLLRELHLKLGVSVDWLLSGKGEMLPGDSAGQAVDSDLARRLAAFAEAWARSRPPADSVWLDVQIQRAVPEFEAFSREQQAGGDHDETDAAL